MTNIVRHQSVRTAIDGRLQNHLISWIGHLRPPSKMKLHRPDPYRQLRQKLIDLLDGKPVSQALFGSKQNLLVFQKQWRAGQRFDPPHWYQTHESVGSTRLAPQSRYDDRCIENEPHMT